MVKYTRTLSLSLWLCETSKHSRHTEAVSRPPHQNTASESLQTTMATRTSSDSLSGFGVLGGLSVVLSVLSPCLRCVEMCDNRSSTQYHRHQHHHRRRRRRRWRCGFRIIHTIYYSSLLPPAIPQHSEIHPPPP